MKIIHFQYLYTAKKLPSRLTRSGWADVLTGV